MSGEEIRLECLKICHRGDRSPENVIAAAILYEVYVLGTKTEDLATPEKKSPGRPKKADKLGILD